MANPVFHCWGNAQGSTAGYNLEAPFYPTAIAANDIIVVGVESANEVCSTPSGYTLLTTIGTGTAGAADATRATLFWKRTAGSEAAIPIPDVGDHTWSWAMAFRGAITIGNPFDVLSTTTLDTASTAVTVPGGTTLVPESLLIAFVASALSTNAFTMVTPGAGLTWTEHGDAGNASGNGGAFAVLSAPKATAGAFASSAGTLSATAAKQAIVLLALRPPSPNADADAAPAGSNYSSVAGYDVSLSAHVIAAPVAEEGGGDPDPGGGTGGDRPERSRFGGDI